MKEISIRQNQIGEYYMEYSTTKSAIKRIQIIVSQNMLKVAECAQQSTGSSRMSLIIKKNKTRYSTKCVPEDRRLTTFNQAAHLDESSASESTDETYHRYPESDHSATHGEECLSDKTSLTGKSNNKEKEKLCSSLKKSTKGNAGKLRDQANEKHVEMCSTAMKVMGRLNKFLDKYDNSNDTDYNLHLLALRCMFVGSFKTYMLIFCCVLTDRAFILKACTTLVCSEYNKRMILY